MELSKALTWDNLAKEYNSQSSERSAQTLPMDTVFAWAERQEDKFHVSKEGTIHKIIKNNNNMKVYLSKSNLANPNIVSKLRQLLIDNGFEVSEWQGGQYNIANLLDDTKSMFQVTHPEGYENIPNIAIYGRGITSEYEAAVRLSNPVYLYDGEDFYIIEESKLLNENNFKTRWAKMKLNSQKLTIKDVKAQLDAFYM